MFTRAILLNMSSERDKYRNPPPPVVYVQTGEPRLVPKKAGYEDDPVYILMSKLLEAKLYDVPNISQYEEFIINPSSDDEIIEVPFVPVPKVVDTVDITAENDEPSTDPPVTIKKERLSPEPPGVSQDSVQTTTTECEVQKHKKKHKKRRKHLESHSKRKTKHKKRSSSHSSEEDSPTDSYGSKKKNYEDSSRRHRRRSSSSSSRSRSRSRHKHRKNYDYSSYSEDDMYYKKGESHSSKRHRVTDERQLGDTDSRRQLRTPSPLFSTRAKVNEEIAQNKNLESTSLYGDYYCKICNITTNNELTYESHVNGKKHRKALENQEKEAHREATLAKIPLLTQAVGKLPKEEQIEIKIPLQDQLSSKYPQPLPGYRRKKLTVPSVIQSFLDNSAKFPCPGLHKVTEIRGPIETVYYCGLCDCNCSYNTITPHLSGYKHQLHCLKYFRSDLFELWNCRPKYQVQNKLIALLIKEEDKNGKGLIQVEKDFKDTDDENSESEVPAFNIRDQPSTSYQSQDADFFETYKYNSLPDPTKSGYYCKLCDSHSNSKSMWSAHIIGKRHIANLKKHPGMAPSKSKYVRAERHVQPILFKIIEEENEYNSPIVGLDQIREIQKPDINGVLFTCFLCGASISAMEILNHIVSPKHREKYLISIKHPEMETLKELQVAETFKSSILEEICGRVQKEEGMGSPDVFYAKR